MEWLYWVNWVCVSPCVLLASIFYGAHCLGQAVMWRAGHDEA
jgi:hypothetical protein